MQVLDPEPVSREEFFAALEKLDNRAKVNHEYIAGEFAYMRRAFEEIFSRLEKQDKQLKEQDKRFDRIDKTLIELKELIIQNGSGDK